MGKPQSHWRDRYSEILPEEVVNMLAIKARLYSRGNTEAFLAKAIRAYREDMNVETGPTECPYCNGPAERGLHTFTSVNNVVVQNVPGIHCRKCGNVFDLMLAGEIDRAILEYEEGTVLGMNDLL